MNRKLAELSRVAVRCARPMQGFYGAATTCARPMGHNGDHYQVHDAREWRDFFAALADHFQDAIERVS